MQRGKTRYDQWVEENPLRRWRRAQGLSTAQAARRLDVSTRTVLAWEEDGDLDADVIRQLVEHLGIPDLAERWGRWRAQNPLVR